MSSLIIIRRAQLVHKTPQAKTKNLALIILTSCIYPMIWNYWNSIDVCYLQVKAWNTHVTWNISLTQRRHLKSPLHTKRSCSPGWEHPWEYGRQGAPRAGRACASSPPGARGAALPLLGAARPTTTPLPQQLFACIQVVLHFDLLQINWLES